MAVVSVDSETKLKFSSIEMDTQREEKLWGGWFVDWNTAQSFSSFLGLLMDQIYLNHTSVLSHSRLWPLERTLASFFTIFSSLFHFMFLPSS